MKFTKKQFENLGFISEELKKKYPEFQGFNGSADDMQLIGLDEAIVIKEIGSINLDVADALRLFSLFQFIRDLNATFTGTTVLTIMPYYAVFKDLAAYKDFAVMKQRLMDLRTAKIVDDNIVNAFKSILMNQGIDLDNLPE